MNFIKKIFHKTIPWKIRCLEFIDRKSRNDMEFEWKLWGNSVHPSVYLPHFYPDYYESLEDWVDAMRSNSYSIPTLSRLKESGVINEY
jgi:hypothetical protein